MRTTLLTVRGRTPPLLFLGFLVSLGCSAGRMLDTRIVNDSRHPVSIEFTSDDRGRDLERISFLLPPGATFRLNLVGQDPRASAKLQGGDMPYGPIDFGFSEEGPRCIILDAGSGIRAEPRPREPQRPPAQPDPPTPEPAPAPEPTPEPGS